MSPTIQARRRSDASGTLPRQVLDPAAEQHAAYLEAAGNRDPVLTQAVHVVLLQHHPVSIC
jgi:hypothetical protein